MMAVGLLAGAAAAVPPPPPLAAGDIILPPNQCPVPVAGTVRAYQQPVYSLTVNAPTVVRMIATRPDPALLISISHADSEGDLRTVVAGAGLAGGDLRISLPTAGRYRLQIGMIGDMARQGRAIDVALTLARDIETEAPACPDPR